MIAILEKEIIYAKTIDFDTKAIIYKSYDKKQLFAQISYFGKKFVVEKAYSNTNTGYDYLLKFINNFQSGKDVETYLKLEGGVKVNLEDLVLNIQKTKALANEKIEGGNPSTLQSRLARKRNAQAALEPLYEQYRSAIRKNMVVMIVTGSEQEQAAPLIENMQTFVSSADMVYEKIVDQLPKNMINGTANPAVLFDMVVSLIDQVSAEIGIGGYVPPLYNSKKYNYKVRNRDEAIEFTKHIINSEITAAFVAYSLVGIVAEKALKDEFASPVVPIAITLKDESIVKDLYDGFKSATEKVFLLNFGKTKVANSALSYSATEATEENVEAALLTVKEILSGKTIKTNNKKTKSKKQ